jgi:hypothetical protein
MYYKENKTNIHILKESNETWGGKCGGVIISFEGTIETSYAQGLGISSKNSVKAYALLQGLMIPNNSNIQKLIVVGDSKVIIN